MFPKYENCVFTDPQPENPDDACTAENICDGRVLSYDTNWDSIYSIHNWIEKLDMMCAPKWKIGMIGSMYFLGWFITLPWLPRLSDKYSRKKIVYLGMVANWIMFIVMYFTTTIDWMLINMLIIGMLTTIRISIVFVYFMELMPKRYQSLYSSMLNASDSI